MAFTEEKLDVERQGIPLQRIYFSLVILIRVCTDELQAARLDAAAGVSGGRALCSPGIRHRACTRAQTSAKHLLRANTAREEFVINLV